MIIVCMKNTIRNVPIRSDDPDELIFMTLYLSNFNLSTKSWEIGNDDFFPLDPDVDIVDKTSRRGDLSYYGDHLCSSYVLCLEI